MQPMLIGLCGYSRSGKDTAAAHLVDKYGFARIAFADKLKSILSIIYEVGVEHFYDDDKRYVPHPHLNADWLRERDGRKDLFASIIEELQPRTLSLPLDVAQERIFGLLAGRDHTPIEATQLIGTEGFRQNVCESIWQDYAIRVATQILDCGNSVAIADVRFPNEESIIKSNAGDIWGIHRSSIRKDTHESERYIGEILGRADMVISNNSDIATLHGLLDSAIACNLFSPDEHAVA